MFVGAYQSIAWFYAATTGQISIQHKMKGPCGVVIAEGRGRARGAAALAPHDPPRRRHGGERRARGADRPLRAHLPAHERSPQHRVPIRAMPTGPSTRGPTATCPARAGRSCSSRTSTSARRARRPADLRRDRRLRRHPRRPPLEGPGAGRPPARAGHDPGARERGRRRRRRRRRLRRRARHARGRRAGGRGDQGGVRRPRLRAARDRAQVDGRPPLRRRRVARRREPRCSRCATGAAADGQPRRAGRGLRPALRHRSRREKAELEPCS